MSQFRFRGIYYLVKLKPGVHREIKVIDPEQDLKLLYRDIQLAYNSSCQTQNRMQLEWTTPPSLQSTVNVPNFTYTEYSVYNDILLTFMHFLEQNEKQLLSNPQELYEMLTTIITVSNKEVSVDTKNKELPLVIKKECQDKKYNFLSKEEEKK